MGNIEEVKKRKEILISLANSARKKKEEVIQFVNDLVSQLASKKITKRDYYDKISDYLHYKSPEEWIKYYDEYIQDCENKIFQCDRVIEEEKSFSSQDKRAKVLNFLILIVFIGILAVLIFNFGPFVYNSLGNGGFKLPNLNFSEKNGEGVINNLTINNPVSGTSELATFKPFSPEVISKNPNPDFSINNIQYAAVVGRNVKWESEVDMKSTQNFQIDIPAGSKVIGLKDETGKDILSEVKVKEVGKVLGIFGAANKIQVSDLIGGEKYSLEFETPAPQISKEEIEKNKDRVVVNSQVHYENILSSVKISEKLNVKINGKEKLKIYQIFNENGIEKKVPIDLMAYDTNEDGIIDKIEWITPHLSKAVFEIVIEISNAEHLDSNRNFINDIYDSVKVQDGNWSEPIYNNEYIRVKFRQALDNSRDITFYARNLQGLNTTVEVYYLNSDEKITEFPVISNEGMYKVLLTNLSGTSDTFDFKIKNLDGNNSAYLEFDYIVDPTFSDCGAVLNQANTVYNLTANINRNDLTDNCINITATNVTLDCVGYYIESDDDYAGVYSNALNTTIKNCNISMSRVNGYGIHLNSANYSLIFNNTLFNNSFGVYLDAGSNNNQVINNSVNSNTYGIRLDSSPNNNLTGNIENLNNYGVILSSSNNVSIINNFATSGYYGIYFSMSSNNKVINNNIWNCSFSTGSCISVLFSSQNNTFFGGLINLSSAYLISVNSGNNNLFKDLILSGSVKNDTYLIGSSVNNTFLNCTYNISRESVDSTSQLFRKWYYQAYVNDSKGNSINNANVSAYNITGLNQFNLTTNASGWTNITFITDYVNNGARNYYSNYTINATNGTLTDEHKFNTSLGNNLMDVFTLGGLNTVSTCINITSPGIYTQTANIVPTLSPCININVSNVSYDGNGTWISNPNLNGIGIYAGDKLVNITVKNCNVSMASSSYSGPSGGYGIKFSNVNDSFIINNTANSIGQRGIYLASSSNNQIINNIVSGYWQNGGIYLTSSSNNTIMNNTANSGSSSDGIDILLNSNNNQIINNTANSNSYHGISIDSGLNNLIIGNTANSNRGTSSSNHGYGIFLSSTYFTSSNNTIINNTANSNTGSGIFLSYNSNNQIINNTLNSNHYSGLYLYSSSNNNFTNNNIWNCTDTTQGCIYIISVSQNNTFIGGLINLSLGNLIYLDSSNNSIFQDLTLLGASKNDTFLKTTSINNIFINCSYNLSKEYVESNSQLIRKWYYRAYVNDSNGLAVSNANVSAWNVTGAVEFSGLMTNSSGWTNINTITDYVNNGTSRNYYSNYTISAIATGYNTGTHPYNVSAITNNLKDVFTLGQNYPLMINFTYPTPADGTNQNFNSIFVNVSANSSVNNITAVINFDNSLVSWWRMDDLNFSGGIVDYMGKNNGTNSSVVQVDDGKFGKAMSFNGVNSSINLSLVNNIPGNTTGTISVWFNRKTNIYDYQCLVSLGNLNANFGSFSICSMSNGKIRATANNNYLTDIKSDSAVTNNVWHNAIITSNNSNYYLYIDGILQSSTGYTTTNNPTFLRIGMSILSTEYFNGSIDDVMIFNRSLTSDEISALYANSSTKYLGVNFTGLSDGNHIFKAYAQDIFGTVNSTETRIVNITSNFLPQITYVEPIPNTDPNSGGVKNVYVNFSVNDGNGYLDINASSARANFSKNGIARQNISCSFVNGNGNIGNYSCIVPMWYFDSPGFWSISVLIGDNSGNYATNNTSSFNYNSYGEWTMVPDSINWSNLKLAISNQLADNNITIYNLGNMNISQIIINSSNLAGETNNLYNITAGNFSIDGCGSRRMIENQNVLSLLTINYTQSSMVANASGNLTFCIPDVLRNIQPQSYSSVRYWGIDVTLALTAFAIKKRKKKRKKENEDLFEILEQNKREIIDSIREELIKVKSEIINREDKKSDILIPVNIFKEDIGAAEVLSRYLHDEKKLKFSEIARLLNRNQRTIWANYNNSLKNKKIEFKEEGIIVPICVFSDRRLSILESVIKHLRDKGLKNSEISKKIGKDPRNIGTFYSRAMKKISNQL